MRILNALAVTAVEDVGEESDLQVKKDNCSPGIVTQDCAVSQEARGSVVCGSHVSTRDAQAIVIASWSAMYLD